MARYRIGADLEFETVTPGELRGELDGRDRAAMDSLRAIKPRRLPPMSAAVTAAGLVIGGDTGQQPVGPTGGNMWFLRLISLTGLTPGATPDTVALQIFGAGQGMNWWEFGAGPAGIPPFSKWGLGELYMESGEYLQFSNVGAMNTPVGTVVNVRGVILQVPQERAGALFGHR